ncbi:MAG: 7-carboxy-7-deazaguanine synthase QueE [Rhodocyclaceae bacterium]|nr:7-carboxy-7-deazaguanine synthase QueE [Rhodocyclaceae bacterium]
MAEPRLRISEIFHSVQGESSRIGLPTVFVRLTGCPLRCVWCDTEYAFNGGEMMSLSDVMAKIAEFKCKTVCVTGGEPLAQKACIDLLKVLCESGYSVSLETSGALDIGDVDSRVARIMDLKAPDSGESDKNRWENIPLLNAHDEIKFVLASEADYVWAVDVVKREHLADRCSVLFSPVQGELSPTTLAEWIVRDHLPVRFQLQLHKILWGSERAR